MSSTSLFADDWQFIHDCISAYNELAWVSLNHCTSSRESKFWNWVIDECERIDDIVIEKANKNKEKEDLL